MTDLNWHPEFLAPFTAIASLTLGFLIYLVVYLSKGFENRLYKKYGQEKGRYYWVVITKLLGAFLLGLVPVFLIVLFLKQDLASFGAGPITQVTTWYWMIPCSLIVLAVNLIQGRKPVQYKVYPLIRKKVWSYQDVVVSTIASSLFILGYEFMFRGFLLHACIPLMGVWVAIAVNVCIYALAHIHKGIGETVGSVPFGILLCYITLVTGNIWAIVIIHLTLSLSADFVGLWANPEMRIKK